MATMRCWYDGHQRRGEMEQLRTYPITREGYVNTWGAMEGWPFPPSPPYDTRHFDTNARFILACWRFYLWTGDTEFLKSQADRLRRAMAYQLETLSGHDGLIITASKDVNGRHKGVGDNYWDILPFGHLDAYANAVYYASLEAMQGIDAVLRRQPLTDYRALRQKVHRRYDEVFWDEKAGRYIGCVDIDGIRHDYGFTFVNLEALLRPGRCAESEAYLSLDGDRANLYRQSGYLQQVDFRSACQHHPQSHVGRERAP
jgi:glycogen debranching enzyme